MSFLLFKLLKGVAVLIVITMGFVALIGEADARSLGNTTAVVGGTSTDIVVTDMIPTFFEQISSENADRTSADG